MTELPIVVNMTVDASRTEYDLTAESNLEEIELLNDTVIETGGSHVPVYEGPYTVDAGLTAVTLDTDGKRLTQDVTVNALTEMTLSSPSITIDPDTGKITATANYTPGYNDLYVAIPSMKPLPTQGTHTYTPSNTEQTILTKGTYITGNIKVRAISSPYADVSGVTATAGDVLSGKYFVDSSGALILGTGTGGGGMDTETKDALLECFEHVAWADSDGQIYYNNLLNALYPLQSISAVYTQSGTVTPSTPLDDLKSDLVVTATFEDGTTKTVTNYTLSGTLAIGTSTVTVTYFTETTTFSVTVSNPYKYIYKLSDNDLGITPGSYGNNYNTCGLFKSTNTNSLNNRRLTYIASGVKPLYASPDSGTTYTLTDEYPVPIPPDATTVTYSITPNTMSMEVSFYTYNENDDKYAALGYISWKRGSSTQPITATAQYFLLLVKDTTTAITHEPTEIIIQFNT